MQCSGRENGNLMVNLIFFCYHSMHLFKKTDWNCKATGIKISGEEEDNFFRHFVAVAAEFTTRSLEVRTHKFCVAPCVRVRAFFPGNLMGGQLPMGESLYTNKK